MFPLRHRPDAIRIPPRHRAPQPVMHPLIPVRSDQLPPKVHMRHQTDQRERRYYNAARARAHPQSASVLPASPPTTSERFEGSQRHPGLPTWTEGDGGEDERAPGSRQG